MTEGSRLIDRHRSYIESYIENNCSPSLPERLKRLLSTVLYHIARQDHEYEQWLPLTRVVDVDIAVVVPVWTFPGELDHIPKNFVIYSKWMMERLSNKATMGVIAHEFAHVKAYMDIKGLGWIQGISELNSYTFELAEAQADDIAHGWGFAEELTQLDLEKKTLLKKLSPKATQTPTPQVASRLPNFLKLETASEEIRMVPENDEASIAELQRQGFTLWKRLAGRVFLKRPTGPHSIGFAHLPVNDSKEEQVK